MKPLFLILLLLVSGNAWAEAVSCDLFMVGKDCSEGCHEPIYAKDGPMLIKVGHIDYTNEKDSAKVTLCEDIVHDLRFRTYGAE